VGPTTTLTTAIIPASELRPGDRLYDVTSYQGTRKVTRVEIGKPADYPEPPRDYHSYGCVMRSDRVWFKRQGSKGWTQMPLDEPVKVARP
jgi:hypothetical protein